MKTKKEMIAEVEQKLDGHTQPPHDLYYKYPDGWDKSGNILAVYCKYENHPHSSRLGICKFCYQKVSST